MIASNGLTQHGLNPSVDAPRTQPGAPRIVLWSPASDVVGHLVHSKGGRVLHTHRQSFVSPLRAVQILDQFRQLVAERRWSVLCEDEVSIHAQTGRSLRCAGENVTVSVDAMPQGSQVEFVVTPRFGAWQVIDWGGARTLPARSSIT